MKILSVIVNTSLAMDTEWWKKMSSADKSKYIKEHPGSKFSQLNKESESDKVKNPNFIAHLSTILDHCVDSKVDDKVLAHKIEKFLDKENMSESELADVLIPIRKALVSAIVLIKSSVGGIPEEAQKILCTKYLEVYTLEGGLKQAQSYEMDLKTALKTLFESVVNFIEEQDEFVMKTIKQARKAETSV